MLALVLAAALAQATSAPGVQLQDEGATQGQVVRLDCAGAGVTCTKSGSSGTITVAGGGGGGNFAEVSLSLGTSGGLVYSVAVTGQAWVTATSQIICSPFGTTTDGQTPETVGAADFSVSVSDRVAATGFTLWVYSPHGATGTFRFHCTGV